jgi:excisionase family DNA binding protein
MGTGVNNILTNQQVKRTQRISNPPCHISKRLYSIKESAVYLGRTAWAVREMLWAGKMPYVKDGKRILIDLQDMNEWIDRSKTKSIY